MSNSFGVFNIDQWWKGVIIVGLLMTIGSVLYPIHFLENKHLFGLGIGLMLLGFGFWISYKNVIQSNGLHLIQWRDNVPSILSVIVVFFGILVSLFFFILLIIDLV